MKVTFQSLLDMKKPFLGMFIQTAAPEMVEAAGYAGFRYAVMDLEHTYYGMERTAEMIRAGEAADMCMLVRVPAMDSIWIKKALDFGASGIIAPNIDTREQAEDLVRRCRYTPEGYRGACPGVRANCYGRDADTGYYARANRDVAVIPLVETEKGVSNFKEIAETPGITAVYLGPADLSVDMGLKGDVNHPRVLQALEQMVHAAVRAGVPVGSLTLNPEVTRHLLDEGMDFVGYGIDTILLYRMCRGIYDEILGKSEDPESGCN